MTIPACRRAPHQQDAVWSEWCCAHRCMPAELSFYACCHHRWPCRCCARQYLRAWSPCPSQQLVSTYGKQLEAKQKEVLAYQVRRCLGCSAGAGLVGLGLLEGPVGGAAWRVGLSTSNASAMVPQGSSPPRLLAPNRRRSTTSASRGRGSPAAAAAAASRRRVPRACSWAAEQAADTLGTPLFALSLCPPCRCHKCSPALLLLYPAWPPCFPPPLLGPPARPMPCSSARAHSMQLSTLPPQCDTRYQYTSGQACQAGATWSGGHSSRGLLLQCSYI